MGSEGRRVSGYRRAGCVAYAWLEASCGNNGIVIIAHRRGGDDHAAPLGDKHRILRRRRHL